MDENIIVYGIQFAKGKTFDTRYNLYETEEERNRALRFFLKRHQYDAPDISEVVVPVTMIIRVETNHVEVEEDDD